MQTAQLVVEYRDDEKVEYAVLFKGYATQRRLYLKRVSHCEQSAEHLQYVCVNKKDTKPLHKKINGIDVSRVMTVTNNIGLMDPRFKELNGIHDIVLIQNAVNSCF